MIYETRNVLPQPLGFCPVLFVIDKFACFSTRSWEVMIYETRNVVPQQSKRYRKLVHGSDGNLGPLVFIRGSPGQIHALGKRDNARE